MKHRINPKKAAEMADKIGRQYAVIKNQEKELSLQSAGIKEEVTKLLDEAEFVTVSKTKQIAGDEYTVGLTQPDAKPTIDIEGVKQWLPHLVKTLIKTTKVESIDEAEFIRLIETNQIGKGILKKVVRTPAPPTPRLSITKNKALS